MMNISTKHFFHTLKTERIYLESFARHKQAQTAVCASIEVLYPRPRGHAAHGSRAPLASEQALRPNGVVGPGK
jgi:hypothetical protein